MFATMAAVFEEDCDQLDPAYVQALLRREDFWAVAAIEDGVVVGGVTAYALPMVRRESQELFIYDVAVRPDRQRQGIGRALLEKLNALATAAGIAVAFVAADQEDTHAIEFYRALGGVGALATFFTFTQELATRREPA
jgi:aminoglycoside 3-N-acetyltransferase I